jgi:hypothetical protein
MLSSAATGAGVADICGVLFEFAALQKRRGGLTRRREQQRAQWMWRKAEDDLVKKLRGDAGVVLEAARLTHSLGRSRLSRSCWVAKGLGFGVCWLVGAYILGCMFALPQPLAAVGRAVRAACRGRSCGLACAWVDGLGSRASGFGLRASGLGFRV